MRYLLRKFVAWLLSPIALSRVIRIPNRLRRVGSDPYYLRIDVCDQFGMHQILLLTEEQYSTALVRSQRNPEDL